MQGHIRKRVHTTKSGRITTNWYVIIELPRTPDGKRRQKWHGGFSTRREAEAARAKLVNEVNRGTYTEPTSITLTDWARNQWLPMIKARVKPSTFDSYRRNLELHVLPTLGGCQLRQLTPPMLNHLYADLLSDGHLTKAGGLSAKTVRYIHTILHKALADAVDTDVLPSNIAERAKPPRVVAPRRVRCASGTLGSSGRFSSPLRGHRLEAAWHVACDDGHAQRRGARSQMERRRP